jgi:hypothetical protein
MYVQQEPKMTKEQRFALDYKKRAERIARDEAKPNTACANYVPLHPDIFTLNEV